MKRAGLLLFSIVMGIVWFLAISGVITGYLYGTTWMSSTLLPFMMQILWPVEILAFVLGGLLSIFVRTRGVSGKIFMWSSYVPGATVWMWSFLSVYTSYGSWGVAIGLFFDFFVGIGVVPIAVVATALKGEWAIVGQVIFFSVLTWGQRLLGGVLIVKRMEVIERNARQSDKQAA